MFKVLYQKSLKLAAHKNSKFFLAALSFSESSFFPVPPDIMIVPMVIAKRIDYIKIFLVATIFSALGGLFGYFLGSFFFDLATNLIQFYGYEEKVLNLKNDLSKGNSFILFMGTLFIAGFTPLPFKVFTITSGIIGFNIFIFFFVCLLSRGLRFFVVSYLSFKLGLKFNKFMEKDANKFFTIVGFIIVAIAGTLYFIIT